jgi:hypothetical protein
LLCDYKIKQVQIVIKILDGENTERIPSEKKDVRILISRYEKVVNTVLKINTIVKKYCIKYEIIYDFFVFIYVAYFSYWLIRILYNILFQYTVAKNNVI